MTIEVNVTSTLRTLVGAKSVAGEGATVGALLADLEAKYPGFQLAKLLPTRPPR